jgi:hypothetical protein
MRLKIFTFIKNEAELLQRWVPHHLSITQPENIFIVDHQSDDASCQELLHEFRSQGLKIVTTSKPFRQKYKVLTQLMHKEKTGTDFLVPLDSDEFISVCTENGFIDPNPKAILEQFEKLPMNGLKYAFNVFEAQPDLKKYSDPLTEMRRFILYDGQSDASGPNQVTKTFFPAHNFSYTDQGNHEGGVLLAPNHRYNVSRISMVHYPIRGYRHFLQKLKKAVTAYDLGNKGPGYSGAGMRWNRWYQQTKHLEDEHKREWFQNRFVRPGEGFIDSSFAERFQQLDQAIHVA